MNDLAFDVEGFYMVERDREEAKARAARHAAVDERCRRVSVWIAMQACADRAALAGKSYNRSMGQLKRWRLT